MKRPTTFPQLTLRYLSDLSKNNNKEWFEENRDRFTFELLEPAAQFVVDLGEKLSKINPELQFFPRINKSIFRLHRDVRFSKNKAPFKNNLGILLWQGSGKKMECSGYYFHLEPGNIFLAAGMYMFTKEQIKVYREKIADPSKGNELNNILKKTLKNEKFKLGGKTLKRIPKGFDVPYKYAELLLHSGLYIYNDQVRLTDFNNNNIVDFCFGVYKKISPLHNWLVENIA